MCAVTGAKEKVNELRFFYAAEALGESQSQISSTGKDSHSGSCQSTFVAFLLVNL